MSKWFAKANDSDQESSSSSEEEKQVPTSQTTVAAAKKVPNKFKKEEANYNSSSESEEEEDRKIVSQKDKKIEALNKLAQGIKNHCKNNDFGELMNDFDKICEEVDKNTTPVLFADGKEGVLSMFVLRQFVRIENCVNDLTGEQKKKLGKQNNTAYTKLKQKMKKYLQSSGLSDNTYEQQITKFKDAPIWTDDEKKKAQPKQETKPEAKPAIDKQSDIKVESEYDSEYDDEQEEEQPEQSESEEEEEEEDQNVEKIPREEMTPAQRRLKWVKKAVAPKQQKEKPSKPAPKDPTIQQPSAISTLTETELKETQLNLNIDFQLDFTKSENVTKKLKDINEERTKGKFAPQFHLQLLQFIIDKVSQPRQKTEVLIAIIHSLFDTSKASSTGFQSRDSWVSTVKYINLLLDQIEQPSFIESINKYSKKKSKDGDEDENVGELERSITPAISNFVEKLDYELLKAFQNIPHSKLEYLQRIRDENSFIFLCDRIMNYLNSFKESSKIARVAYLKLDHIYYKNDTLYAKMKASPAAQTSQIYFVEDSEKVISQLCDVINEFGNQKAKLKATLFKIYHHSIHNRFYQAKDLLMKSHIGDAIGSIDIGSQIIYNRALVQIGMSAFRLGLIEESHDILVETCQTQKLREVLAQGVSRYPDKSVEVEKEELKRQIPFHMHINLQLLDCVYMITAMLLEIPNIAENQYTVNKKIISKTFKKLIDTYDSKPFYLAPENYRDSIVLAAKHLHKSCWRQAVDEIFSLKLLKQIPEFNTESFKDMILFRFKEAALKAFLCRGASSYQSFSISGLKERFEIIESKLIQIIQKMIIRNKIQAHFDSEHKLLLLDESSNELNELQQLSLQYVDKLDHMVEHNERLIDMMTGGQTYNYKERSQNEITQINASKRQKNLIRAAGGCLPNVGQLTQQSIMQSGYTQRQQMK